MSLKIFHICFIVLSTLLSGGAAAWAFSASSPAFAWSCVGVAIAMPIYGIWFLNKTRKLIL